MRRFALSSQLALLVSLFILANPAYAETETMYTVEVVVFRNLDSGSDDNEVWFKQTSDNKQNFTQSIITGGTPSVDSELGKAVEKMAASGSYEILVHKRWLQNANIKSESNFIRIRSGGEQKGVLDGQIMFYVSRFLHVNLDLLLQDPDYRQSSDDVENGKRVFQIQEQRRVKTVDINYFDHPRFSALVQIIPVGK